MTLEARIEQAAPIPLAADIACEAGELLALVGPSGSGKSTILRCLAGLHRPRGGFVRCAGETWFDAAAGIDLRPQQRRIGFVFQNYGLFPHLSALDNVAASLGDLPAGARPERAREWLARVNLDGLEKRYPAQLSGGQQQRVALARALAREPRALLLDEPFSAVDQVTRKKLLSQLAKLRHTLAIPIVLVTHDLEEANLLADRMTVLHHGRTLQTAAPAEVLSRPVSALVARLTDQRNLFTARVLQHLPEAGSTEIEWLGQRLVAPHTPQFAPGATVSWVIPADRVVLVRDHQAARANTVRATVSELMAWRGYASVVARVDGCHDGAISFALGAPVVARHKVVLGGEVLLQLLKEGIRLLPCEEPAQ